jgi:hypothetical protein
VWVLAASTPAHAEPTEGDVTAPHFGGQRQLGLGPLVGSWSGAGLSACAGLGPVKVWASGGYLPLLIFGNATADKAVRFNYYGSYQLGGDVAVRVRDHDRVGLDLRLGYRFNSVLGHGGSAGVGVLYDLSRRVGLDFSAGLSIFPSGRDRLVREQGYPLDRTPALTPDLQAGGNVALVIYP